MTEQSWAERFPRMTKVSSPPALFRINGCGVALYGRRDTDRETGTYVATWCLCLLFIPVICLRAFRVAPAETGGWYFVGREPLSGFAKGWNAFLVLLVAGGIGLGRYSAYTNTPAYKARQEMAAAGALAGKGQLAAAANSYRRLALAGADEADNADAALRAMLDGPCAAAPLGEDAKVFSAAVDVCRRRHSMPLPDLAAKGLKLATDRGDTDPRNALAVLDAVRPLVLDTRPVDARRVQLFRKWAAAEPTNLDAVAPLATALVDDGKAAEAKALLLPLRDKLGDGEGARALGLVLAREGDHDGAYALLRPYVKAGLDRLHAAEQEAEAVSDRVYKREVNTLEQDKAFMRSYHAAGSDAGGAMVRDRIAPVIRADPEYVAASEALGRAEAVVPAALELGIAMLQRAQAQPAGDARTAQLKAAEQVFLDIRGAAGQSDEYRLALGEVYYWLGRQADGRKELDALLASKGRGPEALVTVALTLRGVGAEADARALAEEAFGKAADAPTKAQAARVRSLMYTDVDDQVAWLRKSDASNPTVRASLAQALGEQALAAGRDAEAAVQYQAALDALAAMPHSAQQLNEIGIAAFGLYRASGDRKSFDRAIDSMRQAIELKPGDTILLFNAGVTTLDASLADLAAGTIDLRTLRESGGADLCQFLYRDAATRDALAERVRAHPGVAKAVGYLEKVTVLAPKNARAYAALQSVYSLTRNEPAVAALKARSAEAGIDDADALRSLRVRVARTRDAQDQASTRAALARADGVAPAARAKGGATAAVALYRQAECQLALDMFGQGDVAKAVALADEARQLAPSAATDAMASTARLYRAARGVRSADAAAEAYFAQHERTIGISRAVAAATGTPGPLRDALLAQSDVREAASIIRQQSAGFPDGYDAYEWALLKSLDDPAAEQAASAIRAAPRKLVHQSLSEHVHPSSPGVALDGYWLWQALGRPDQAKAEADRAAGQGFPLPVQP